VYCFSRKDTESLAKLLIEEGFSAGAYHAGLESSARADMQDDFIHDRINIITATTAFGMGIDKPDVRMVIHRTFPKTLEGYYQEIGRAGRDGLPSECVMLYSAGDKIKLDYFLGMVSNEKERQKELDNILEVMGYAESRSCRWVSLIKYFGEKPTITSCGTCDVCKSKTDTVDATEITQKILSGIIKTEERFGKAHILKVLRGSKEKKVIDHGHDSLSVWGISQDVTESILSEVFMQLLAHGFIQKHEGDYPTFYVTKAGREFLTKKETLELPRVQDEMLLGETDPTPTHSSSSTKKKKSRIKKDFQTDEGCFEVLKVLRKKTADKKGVPAFVIFGDASLHDMSFTKPQTIEAFGKVTGVGEKKLKEHGDTFMEAIARYIEDNPIGPRN
jgi:ATP-dependent DNA helicase RecQ